MHLRKQTSFNLNNHAVLNSLGLLYTETKEYSKARSALEKANELKPNDTAILNSLAMLSVREHNFESALAYLEQSKGKRT